MTRLFWPVVLAVALTVWFFGSALTANLIRHHRDKKEAWKWATLIADGSLDCESCGQQADIRLDDGTCWCQPCHTAADRLGYNEPEDAA